MSILIGFLAYLLTGSNGHFAEVIERAVVDIKVYIAFDARQATGISMLPELPGSCVLHFFYIVVGYPIGIGVERWCVKIFELEFVISIDYGSDAVMALYNIKPLKYAGSEFVISLILWLTGGRSPFSSFTCLINHSAWALAGE